MAVSLGRGDWRFLLPAPPDGMFRHLVLLGGPPGLGDRLQSLGTAARVDNGIGSDGSPDALVLLADSDVSLRTASRGLAPDAVVYWEIDRRHWPTVMRGPQWITRQLHGAGLREIAAYWVIPDFYEARRYLPLDSPQAIHWFFTTRFVAGTPARVALESLILAALRFHRPSIRMAVPCLALVATGLSRAFSPAEAMSHPLLPASLRGRDIHPVFLTSGQDEGSRLVALPFAGTASVPEVVVKIARLPSFSGHTEQEQATLSSLRGMLPPDLRRSLPAPNRMVGPGGRRIFLESVVPGRMLAASVGRWRAPARDQVQDLRLAADWLADFQQATLVRRLTWDGAAIDRWVEQPLAGYDSAFGARPHERRLFDAVRRRARSLIGRTLPIVWTHNDFNPWHVYRSGGRVSVIDWEFGGDDVSERQGLPLCDLVYFVTHWLYLARGLRRERAKRAAFRDLFITAGKGDARCTAARETLLEYTEKLELDRGFLPLLTVHTWVDRAVDQHRRRVGIWPSGADPRSSNAFASNVEALAHGADELFVTSAPT